MLRAPDGTMDPSRWKARRRLAPASAFVPSVDAQNPASLRGPAERMGSLRTLGQARGIGRYRKAA